MDKYWPRILRGIMLVSAIALITMISMPGLANALPLGAGSPAARPGIPIASGGAHATAAMRVRALCAAPTKDNASCSVLQRTDVAGHEGLMPQVALPSGYGPADLRSAYDLPSSGGAGATIAVVNAFDDPSAEADLAVYRQQYGLPPCTSDIGCFRKVDERGGASYPGSNVGFAAQTSVALDMVSAICPQCHLLLVEADSSGIDHLGAAVNEAVALGARFVVAPWGFQDGSWASPFDQYFNHPGVAITASTDGPGGSYQGVPLYPAASPYVTAVGGTSLTRDAGTVRGWSEGAWNNEFGFTWGGCSASQPKPAFQKDRGCTTRTVADVSAVADPFTGVAAYDTFQQSGWNIYGGTGVAASIVAGVYALAGTPGHADNPVSYPYHTPTGLNDITTGFIGPAPGGCQPDYLCDAGPGYDAPTGWGSPHGLAGFAVPSPHGQIAGRVTDARTGRAVAGATVQAGPASASTDAAGHFDLWLPAGSHLVTVSDFGYRNATVAGVTVTAGQTTTRDVAVDQLPSQAISGKVTDAGHGWPVYARIVVSGDPVPVFSDPFTGRYAVTVPDNTTYTLHITAEYPGYQPADHQVVVGSTAVTADQSLTAAALSPCQAPGYTAHYQGLPLQTFDASTAPAGWSVRDASGMTAPGWVFNNPARVPNRTGGSGNFAVTSLAGAASDGSVDSFLVTPVMDLSSVAAPVISFDNYATGDDPGYYDLETGVQLSTDGGSTWTQVAGRLGGPNFVANGRVSIAIPQAAGKSQVQVRFEFHVLSPNYTPPMWQLDDVYVGAVTCAAVPGGMAAGLVTDANTGSGIDGAAVTGSGGSGPVTTAAIAGDPRFGHGFYWSFLPAAGQQQVTATAARYTAATATVNIQANTITRADLALRAGRLVIEPSRVTGTTTLGGTTSATMTVANTGTAPATVTLVQRSGGVTVLGRPAAAVAGAPLQMVSGTFPTRAIVERKPASAARRPAAAMGATDTGAWVPVTSYPTAVADNAVVEGPDGTVYSIGGQDGNAVLPTSYAYRPGTQAWQPMPLLPSDVGLAAAAMLGDKIVVAGGYNWIGSPTSALQVFDPGHGTWSVKASMPAARFAAGAAALGGKLYVVGGCTTAFCQPEGADVFAYDLASDSWTRVASYPIPVAYPSCGAVGGELVCAGGEHGGPGIAAAYAYNPAANKWTAIAPLPIDLWGSGYTAANGQFLVSGGVTAGSQQVTNAGFAYSPDTNTWTALPNSADATYRGGSACGFYTIGGVAADRSLTYASEQLPGYDQCNGAAPWLSASTNQVTLQPGQRIRVTLTMNAHNPATVGQPGSYTATLDPQNDTPYVSNPVTVTMNVKPPRTWGEVTGNVSGTACSGSTSPLAGASVQVSWAAGGYALRTDAAGRYALWLDQGDNPLTIIAGGQGWAPQTATASITGGKVTTADFTLRPASPCA